MKTEQQVIAKGVTQERQLQSSDGYLVVGIAVLLIAAGVYSFVSMPFGVGIAGVFARVLPVALGAFLFAGLYMLQPNEAALLSLFGKYKGTDRSEGLRWVNPLYSKRKLSLRARTLNTAPLKVNDKRGNPVEIGAAIVWRVRDSALAIFNVDDFERYVNVQAEAALRHIASLYAYDDGEDLADGETTLRAGMEVVASAMRAELQTRFAAAGIDVEDAKLTHLAYAAEIAQVMLRRQQAEAIISARKKIVHGAVSMVEAALQGLSERQIVELDDERKAAMVSNLLVVLCSDKETQPVINTGTLYN
ncbi:SPFH domain-containing protein [Undibacterium rugosum]|uniref:SPFH domain-containing protein n=1 Tax=Undibacterium rugosum TaxID=2762291 RepID=A0A923HXM6_9BURK|nr:SPFH domain-containing protein [Undibacterium rugosum]MBC3934058.1 SPFH domain-containing protein [Undibacterium rugosum]MBR7779082.1 SPFH domain-containing protein [Undibacterium rugosum]